ncbi:hypothetical protein PG984_006994 [Apiospora sp. TS-2023a]
MEPRTLSFDVDVIPIGSIDLDSCFKDAPDVTKRVVTSKMTLADVLCRYLRVEDPVSVAEARDAIVNFLPGEGDPSLRDSGGESVECLTLYAAEQSPSDHPFQTKQVRLMATPRGSCEPDPANEWDLISDEPPFKKDLQRLYGTIHDRHKLVFGDGGALGEAGRRELARRWVNRHAFNANLYGIGWVNMSMNCAHVMEYTFTKPPAARAADDPAWRDSHVAAASQWITYSGPALSREVKSPSGAKTATGFPAAISLGDWRRWRDGFRGAAMRQHAKKRPGSWPDEPPI